MLFCLVWMLYHLQLPKVPRSEVSATVLFVVLLTLNSTCSFALTPAALVQCSAFTMSLVSGLIIFGLSRQENISLVKVGFVMLCIAGVVFVIQPWHRKSTKQALEWSTKFAVNESCISIPCELYTTRNTDMCRNLSQPLPQQVMNICQNQSIGTKSQTHLHQLKLCRNKTTCWIVSKLAGNYYPKMLKMNDESDFAVEFLLFKISPRYMTTTGIFFALFAGLTTTLLTFSIKRKPCLSENRFRSMLWAFTVCLLCSLILTFILEDPVWPKTLFDTAAISVHCVASVTTWFFLVYAMEHISGTVVNIIYSTSVVFFLVPQYTILASVLPGHRNWMEVVGAFMVLLGSVSWSLHEIFSK